MWEGEGVCDLQLSVDVHTDEASGGDRGEGLRGVLDDAHDDLSSVRVSGLSIVLRVPRHGVYAMAVVVLFLFLFLLIDGVHDTRASTCTSRRGASLLLRFVSTCGRQHYSGPDVHDFCHFGWWERVDCWDGDGDGNGDGGDRSICELLLSLSLSLLPLLPLRLRISAHQIPYECAASLHRAIRILPDCSNLWPYA